MLYPLVASPNFILNTTKNDDHLDKFIEFYKRYKDVWTDIFILIDDEKNSLIENYKKIYSSDIATENPEIRKILDIIFKLKQYKHSNIKIKEQTDINNIADYLKKNGVKKIVQFPEYFDEEFINIKKLQPKINLYNTTYEEVNEEICSITRFSKKVFLNDAMIPYYVSNLQNIHDIKDISNDPEDFKFMAKKQFKYYQLGFQTLIKNIYNANFFRDELEIYIYTTIQHAKIKKVFDHAINNYDEERLELWNNLGNYIIESIKKCISIEFDPYTKSVKDIIIKSHFKDHIKHVDQINYEVYDRSIFVLDQNSAIEIRKGIDIFDEKTKNGLRADSGYHIRNYLDENELENARQIIEHPDYKPKTIYKPRKFN